MGGLINERVKLLGADVFVVQKTLPSFAPALAGFAIQSISNRGTKIWPNIEINCELVDVFRCRFYPVSARHTSHDKILGLLGELEKLGFEWVHVEKLLEIQGKPGFSEMQGV